MSDETEKSDQSVEGESQSPEVRPEQPPIISPKGHEEIETVSLLDLMQEREQPASPSHRPTPGSSDEETDAIDFPPGETPTAADVEEATLTQAPIPSTSTTQTPAPLPLSKDELTPKKRPLERDQEATEVQPRVAFPGSGKPVSEQPTQVYRPLQEREEPEPKDAPTLRRPPLLQPAPARQPQEARPRREPQPTRPIRQRPVSGQPEPARVIIPQKEAKPRPKLQSPRRRNWRGCFSRLVLVAVILGIAGVAFTVIGAAVIYANIASDLPVPTELISRASDFETARIYDRNGNELYALADPSAGNRTRVELDEISPFLIDATIATEDARFYQNPGFDPIGIARAIWQAAKEREIVSGASTITQQLVRAVLLDEEERTEQSFRRKVREIILAAELSRTYEKDVILELYLNEIYYGNRAYGIEAAAQTYFDKSAAGLNLAEASLLAGLPQAPALWDPYTAPDKAIGRQWEVLSLMVEGKYISLDDAQRSLDETNLFIYNMTPPVTTIKSPHFTFTVLQQAEDQLGAQSIYRGGLRIYTTLDPLAQRLAQETITANKTLIQSFGANNAALVAIQPGTGEILALVGSLDFNDETIDGQVNMALAPRQPGSTIKPLVYLSAMEKGWTPSTLIWDVPTQFPNGTNPPYVPKNYDDQFHGPLRLRSALGNSYNIPAVKALEFVGVCNFIANVQKIGLVSLQDGSCNEVGQPRNYGLALSLGGGEISPLEMAGAFNTLASQGRFLKPYAITRIENRQGDLLFEHIAAPENETQVVRPEHAYLLSHILSDNDARQPEFGFSNNLVIPGHRAAAKTGTSGTTASDVRDGWTIGFTPHLVTVVWVGNTDNQPIGQGASGYRVASPIWNSFMTQYLSSKQQMDFVRPPGVAEVEICVDSGTRPSPDCSNRSLELFAENQPPLDSDKDFVQKVPIDLWTNLQATAACVGSIYEANFFTILVEGNEDVKDREEEAARRWLEETNGGQAWANRRGISMPLRLPPDDSCDENTPRPEVFISQPAENSEIKDIVEIRGTVGGPGFAGYRVEYGISHDPGGWGLVQELRPDPVQNGLLATWDTSILSDFGPVTLRVIIFGPDNRYTEENDPVTVEERVLLLMIEPTPTPTSTPTETPTPTSTVTQTVTPTETPTTDPNVSPSPTTSSVTQTPTIGPSVTPAVPGGTPTP